MHHHLICHDLLALLLFRDRTAQLTTLAQIMLDPYYRTMEGILVLIQKEWCAFGHKFEERLNRISHMPKEASPVFLQVLDAIYQLLIQFPTSFEYTEDFLLLLVYLTQSGVVSTFRGNNERERILFQRAGLLFEDSMNDDIDCSSLAFYMHLLLRTSNWSRLLRNVHYIPPCPDEKKVQYLRPRCANHDVLFWENGLFGLNHNIPDISALGGGKIASAESNAMATDLTLRLSGLLDALHTSSPSASPQVEARILQEILKTTPYPCNPLSSLLLSSSSSMMGEALWERDRKKFQSILTSLSTSSTTSAYLYPRHLIFSQQHGDLARSFLKHRIIAILPDEEDHFLMGCGRESKRVSNNAARSSASIPSAKLKFLSETRGLEGEDELESSSGRLAAKEDSDDEDDGDATEDDVEQVSSSLSLLSLQVCPNYSYCRGNVFQRHAETGHESLSARDNRYFSGVIATQERHLRLHAVITIQIWFRALLAARLSIIVHGVAEMDYFRARPYGSTLPKKQRKKVQAFWHIFRILATSYLKGKRSLQDYLYQSRATFARGIVDEVIAKAVEISQREKLAFQLAENMLQTMMLTDGSFSMTSPAGAVGGVGDASSPKPNKTLSSRLLKPFIGGSSSHSEARSVSPVPGRGSSSEAPGLVRTLSQTPVSTSESDDALSPNAGGSKSSKSFTMRMMSGFMK